MNVLQTVKEVREQKRETKYKSAIKVGLMSNSGFGNLGEIATQQAIMQNIRRYCPDAVIHSFSPNPEGAEKELNIPSFPTNNSVGNRWLQGNGDNPIAAKLNHKIESLRALPYHLRSLPYHPIRKLSINIIGTILELLAWIRAYQYLKSFDVLIVSGGGQLDDQCWGGRWGYPFTLLLWGVLAKLGNVKYCMVSVGGGPIDFPASRLLIKWALSLAKYRSYRDEDSQRYIKEIVGFKENDRVYPDLVHSLDLAGYRSAVDRQKPKSQEKYRLVVGINPYICAVMTGDITSLTPPYPSIIEDALYLPYVNKLADFVSWLLQNQYAVRLLASETNEEYHDSHQVSQDIKAILKQNGVAYDEEQIIEDPIQTVEDFIGQLAMTDAIVGSRFHTILLSQLMKKPAIALSFHSKVDLLMANAGQEEYCLQIDKFDSDVLKERFMKLEANRDSIKQQIAKRSQEYREALNEQYHRLFNG
jgi:polysaccharide pyruvyl transferase WcaK-like protein